MLKNPLLSGWFRVQPFLKCCIVTTLVSPIIIVFVQSTLAEQSRIAKNASGMEKSDAISQDKAVINQPESATVEVNLADSQLNNSDSKVTVVNPALGITNSQAKLAEKIPQPENQSLPNQVNSPVPIEAKGPSAPAVTEIPIDGQPKESQGLPEDPVGSPHPVPWNWMMMTQATIGKQGGSGVKQYRSLPVVSPDGKYAIYSRVQMEVKPEMYDSRVTSVLFIEDKQTGRLKVLTATSPLNDPLLKRQPILSEQPQPYGTIGVLVPVSWSQKSDRFLARKFTGIFNTADVTDYAVIWDRQQNRINTVTPNSGENDHENIAVLLGWSKRQPNNVLFRAGVLGEENWPLLEVTSDGKTMTTAGDQDQPVTFGQRNPRIWAEPQVAYR